jgi:hypothetical protein
MPSVVARAMMSAMTLGSVIVSLKSSATKSVAALTLTMASVRSWAKRLAMASVIASATASAIASVSVSAMTWASASVVTLVTTSAIESAAVSVRTWEMVSATMFARVLVMVMA